MKVLIGKIRMYHFDYDNSMMQEMSVTMIHLYYISISLRTIEEFCFRYPFLGIKSSVGTEGQVRDRVYICKHGYCVFRTLLEILPKLLPSPTDILSTGGPSHTEFITFCCNKEEQVYKHMIILHSNHIFLKRFLIIPCTPLLPIIQLTVFPEHDYYLLESSNMPLLAPVCSAEADSWHVCYSEDTIS